MACTLAESTLYTESSDSFVASAAASIATGWSEPVPGRELHPLKSSAFHGALLRQRSRSGAPPAPFFQIVQVIAFLSGGSRFEAQKTRRHSAAAPARLPQLDANLLVLQRRRRVKACGVPRQKMAGHQCHRDQSNGSGRERHRIARTYPQQ